MAKWFNFIKKRGQKNTRPSGRVAISLAKEGIALAHCLYDEAGLPALQFCEFYPHDEYSIANQSVWLSQIVQSHELNGIACSWVLVPPDYTFLMVQAPDVPSEKINMAVRWQVKELIDFPLQEALIDTCPVPIFGHGGRKMLHAAVVRQSKLLPPKQAIEESGLLLSVIDVAELALRNVAEKFSSDKKSIALLWLATDCAVLTLSSDNNLFFSRRVQIDRNIVRDEYVAKKVNSEATPEVFERLILMIQQSLDYFESQMAQALPDTLVIMPLPFKTTELKKYLSENLPLTVILGDLNTVLVSQQELTLEVQSQCIAVLGCLLGKEEGNYASAD